MQKTKQMNKKEIHITDIVKLCIVIIAGITMTVADMADQVIQGIYVGVFAIMCLLALRR